MVYRLLTTQKMHQSLCQEVGSIIMRTFAPTLGFGCNGMLWVCCNAEIVGVILSHFAVKTCADQL